MTIRNFLKSKIKPSIFTMLYYSGVFDTIRFHQKNRRVSIIMYHRFSKENEPFKVRQNVFEQQIEFINKRYTVITLSQFIEYLHHSHMKLPPNPVLITIDDGYADNYTYAYPILKHFGISATIFLSTNFINHGEWLWSNKLEYILKNTPVKSFSFPLGDIVHSFNVEDFLGWHKAQLIIFNHCAQVCDDDKNTLLKGLADYLKVSVPQTVVGDYIPLNWQQIKEMKQNGIDFGSHSCSHPILSRIDSSQLIHELLHSKNEIEKHLDCSIRAFCYPNGRNLDITDEVVKKTQDVGYACAFTTIPGYNTIKSDPYRLNRIAFNTDDRVKIFKQLISF